MLEKDLEKQIIDLAIQNHWKAERIEYRHQKAGCPDLMLLKNNRVLFFEVKRPGGKSHKEQAEELKRFKRFFNDVFVVDNLELAGNLLGIKLQM